MSAFVVIEGDTDEPVARKLVQDAGLEVLQVFDAGGKGSIDKWFVKYNQASLSCPWFVLRDLDRDASCAPGFLKKRKIEQGLFMAFRLAVRELEAWLLADREGIAQFLAVPSSLVPRAPDEEPDPTLSLISLARRSKRRAIERALVPRPGDSAQVGPGYEAAIIDFGSNHWDLERACVCSPSLRKARSALHALSKRWHAFIAGPGP